MNNIILLIVAYILYLLLWFVINLVFYFVSMAFRKPQIYNVITGVSMLVVYLLNFIVGLGMLVFGISLLLDKEFLWFLFYFFIGATLISWIFSIVQFPFIAIASYFSEKIEEKDFDEEVVANEIINKKGEIVKKTEGDVAVSSRVAKYFIVLYFINLLPLFLFSAEREGTTWDAYILKPFSGVVLTTILLGVPYGIYNKFKEKLFFTKDKRYFFIKIWKVGIYIYMILLVLVYLLSWLAKAS